MLSWIILHKTRCSNIISKKTHMRFSWSRIVWIHQECGVRKPQLIYWGNRNKYNSDIWRDYRRIFWWNTRSGIRNGIINKSGKRCLWFKSNLFDDKQNIQSRLRCRYQNFVDGKRWINDDLGRAKHVALKKKVLWNWVFEVKQADILCLILVFSSRLNIWFD